MHAGKVDTIGFSSLQVKVNTTKTSSTKATRNPEILYFCAKLSIYLTNYRRQRDFRWVNELG